MTALQRTKPHTAALLIAATVLLAACGQNGSTTAKSDDTAPTPSVDQETVEVETTGPPVVAPDGYPFTDAVDIEVFEPWSITNSGAGDCWRTQNVLVSEEMGIESDETTCSEHSAENHYYLSLLDETLRVHIQQVEADDAGTGDEAPYFVTEQVYDFESDPAMFYERTGRVDALQFDRLDTAFTATPIENPDAMLKGLLSLRAEGGPDHYICYLDDAGVAPALMVAYGVSAAQWVKYEGQVSNIVIELETQSTVESTLVDTYVEFVDGQANGTYTLAHSGNWDYVDYERPDGETFTFTIDFDRSVDESGGYTTEPCF